MYCSNYVVGNRDICSRLQQTVHLKGTEIQLIWFYTLIQQNIKKSLSVHNSNNSILFNKEDILELITIRT